MSNVSTFGAFTMAKLGIYASQKAMQVTGNNITNINTPGYTRQELELKSLYVGGSDRYASKWDAKTGSGVLVTGVTQIRSPYLDIRYRTQNSSVGAANSKLSGLNGLTSIFDEVGDGEDDEGVMEAALQDLIQQMSNYSTNGAGQETYDSILKGSAQQIVTIFNDYAGRLEDLYQNQAASLQEDVKTVNSILSEIQKLNNSIRKAEIHGSNALELKDERNNLIDSLSGYIRINVLYEEEDVGAGMKVDKLVIKLDSNDPHSQNKNVCLIDGRYATQLEVPALNIPDVGNGQIPVETVTDWDRFMVTLDELRDVNGNPRMLVEGMPITYGVSLGDGATLTAGQTLTIGDVSMTVTADMLDENAQDGMTPLERVLRALADEYYKEHGDEEDGWEVSINSTLDGLIFRSKQNCEAEVVLDADGNPTSQWNLPAGLTVPTVSDPFQTRQISKGLEPVPYPQGRIDLTDNDIYGSLQSSRELLTEKGCFATDAEVAADPDAATKCGIPYYQKMWDAMAVKFAKMLNEANTLVDPNPDPATAAFRDANNNPIDLIKENGKYVVDPQNYFVTDDDGNYLDQNGNIIANPFVDGVVRDQFKGGVLFSNSGDNDDPAGITAKNISIAFSWDKGAVHVMQSRTNTKEVQSSQNSNLEHMHAILANNKHVYKLSDTETGGYTNDVEYFKGDFGEMLTKIASVLASDVSTTQEALQNGIAALTELTVDRDSVSGVDLNDEAIAMMQYNKSYAAACRFMTQLDEMLDKLINGTAL